MIRRRPSGTEYLDCRLSSYCLTFEIDGAGHQLPEQKLTDLLRDIAVVTDGDAVIRLPLETYHLGREQVLDRIDGLLRSRGWQPAASAA